MACGTPRTIGSEWGMGSVCDVLALPMPHHPLPASRCEEGHVLDHMVLEIKRAYPAMN